MGTRGTYGFIYKAKEVSFYRHFDSYPDGLGDEIITEIDRINDTSAVTEKDAWKDIKRVIGDLVDIDTEKKPTKIQIEKYKKYANLNVSEQSYEDWYCLFRNIQDVPDMFDALFYGDELKEVVNGAGFLKDSLYCEYGYIINLDTMKLELFRGFQKKPQKGNRYGETSDDSYSNSYYPCKLIGELDLESINPKEMHEIFVREDIIDEDDFEKEQRYKKYLELKEEFEN